MKPTPASQTSGLESLDTPPGLRTARVARIVEDPAGDPHLFLDPPTDGASVMLAVSCLLTPETGDTVLIAPLGGRCVILAVIDRQPGTAARLAVPGTDAVSLEAPDLSLTASRSLSVRSSTVSVDSEAADLRVTRTKLIGRTVLAVARTLETVSDTLRNVARQMTVRTDERVTAIAGTDSYKAGQQVSDVETVQINTSKQTVIVGEEDVRLDAKRITMG